MAWRVGMKVVCVDDDPKAFSAPDIFYEEDHLDGLRKDDVYTIRDVGIDWMEGDPVLFLEEIVRETPPDEPEETGYSAFRFRPATDISFAHEILRTVTETDPAFERAMAEAYPDRLPEYVRDRT